MKKYENFCKAFDNLKNIYDYEPPYKTVELTGLVGLYEICFEQSWKMMKELLEISGFVDISVGSPRSILKMAYTAGMITDEQKWLEALWARNNASHSYNEEIALSIIEKTKEIFYAMFLDLKGEVEAKWV